MLCRTVHILISRMQSRVVHYSTMKCSAVMGRAVRFRPALVVQCNTVHKVQCSALQCSAVQFSEVQYSAVQCTAQQYNAVKCSAMQLIAVQYSEVLCDKVH